LPIAPLPTKQNSKLNETVNNSSSESQKKDMPVFDKQEFVESMGDAVASRIPRCDPIDYDLLAEKIAEALTPVIEINRVDEALLAEKLAASVDVPEIDVNKLAASVANRIHVDVPSQPGVQKNRYVVVVARQEGAQWARLASAVARARESWSKITVAQPPEDRGVGPLPALVYYEDGTPVKQYRGQYEVLAALSEIHRNEFAEE
jgi:hypothetical protein